MRKKHADLFLGIFMLLLFALLADRGVLRVSETPALPESAPPVVVIDSGHGGDDPGKVGINQSREKEINLAIAKKLEQRLTENGITVIMTRETDEDLSPPGAASQKAADLSERCRIINEAHALFAVSIHQNSYHDPSVSGPQVFYYKNSPEGKFLAETLQAAFDAVTEKNTRKAKGNDNYYLLLNTECPVVIAECGFLSNPEEAEKLITEEYQDAVARALCEGILSYIDQTNSGSNR